MQAGFAGRANARLNRAAPAVWLRPVPSERTPGHVTWTEHPIFFLDFEGSPLRECLNTAGPAVGRPDRRGEDAAVRGHRPGAGRGHGRPWAEGGRPEGRAAACRGLGVLRRLEGARTLGGALRGRRKRAHEVGLALSAEFAGFVRPRAVVMIWAPGSTRRDIYASFSPGRVGPAGGPRRNRRAAGRTRSAGEATVRPGRRRYHAALYDALAGALLLAALAREPRHARLSLGHRGSEAAWPIHLPGRGALRLAAS